MRSVCNRVYGAVRERQLPVPRQLLSIASFDHLGESISSEAEAEAEVREYLRALGRIESGGIRANVSVKLTQLGLDIDEHLCLGNTRRIVEEAARRKNFVRIDIEDSTKNDMTLRVFRRLREQYENVGVAIQAYLYRSERDIEDLVRAQKSAQRGMNHFSLQHQGRARRSAIFFRETILE